MATKILKYLDLYVFFPQSAYKRDFDETRYKGFFY